MANDAIRSWWRGWQVERNAVVPRYASVFDCARQVVAADGLALGLFRGFCVTVWDGVLLSQQLLLLLPLLSLP